MSSAIPLAFCSAMSMMTTSASSLSATARATVAPTLPAPPTTVTFLFIDASTYELTIALDSDPATSPTRQLHVRYHRFRELRRLELRGALHLAREVVGDLLLIDCLF